MKSEGPTGAVVAARSGIDVPTEPFKRPAGWPVKPERAAWTSPIRQVPDDEQARAATAAAERAAAAAAAVDERKRLTAIRKASKAAPAPLVAKAAPVARPKPAAPPTPAPRPRPGVLDAGEVEALVEAGLARMTPAAPIARERAPRPPSDLRTEIVRLYVDEGLDGRQIADRLGKRYGTVHSNLRAAGVTMRPGPLPPRPVSKVDIDEAVRLYDEGWTTTRLAGRYGVTSQAVASRLRGAGVTMRPTVARQLHAEAVERRAALEPQLRALFEQGLTYPVIAERLGVSRTYVQRAVADLGLKRRQRLDAGEVVRLYVEEQLGTETIAKRLGTVAQAVRYQLRKAGVQMRPHADTVRRTDTDVVVEALTRLRGGDPVMVVAQALGLGATTVARFRDAAGIPARPSGVRRDARLPRDDNGQDGQEDDGEPSPGSRRALLDALLVERYGPAPARPPARRPPVARAAADAVPDPLPDTARRRRALVAGANAEEAS